MGTIWSSSWKYLAESSRSQYRKLLLRGIVLLCWQLACGQAADLPEHVTDFLMIKYGS